MLYLFCSQIHCENCLIFWYCQQDTGMRGSTGRCANPKIDFFSRPYGRNKLQNHFMSYDVSLERTNRLESRSRMARTEATASQVLSRLLDPSGCVSLCSLLEEGGEDNWNTLHRHTMEHDVLVDSMVEAMRRIKDSNVNAVLVQRSMYTIDVSLAQQELATIEPFKLQAVAPVQGPGLEQSLGVLFGGLPNLRDRSYLRQCLDQAREDAALIVQSLPSAVDGTTDALVGIEVIQNQPCSRWHADHVPLRLLVSYIGAGTEFVPNRFVDRCAASSWVTGGRTSAIADTDLPAVVRCRRPLSGALKLSNHGGFSLLPGAPVRQAGPGEVLLLKGGAFPGCEGLGAVHRSPGSASESEPRLVLKIDPLTAEQASRVRHRLEIGEEGCNCGSDHEDRIIEV